ncbi:hypothetical protein, partial [Thermodesulfitimonas autotrophica]|uniref:hypothetical protein n=1 Tax=Thermodesulfitimonas autotrophica TaxID=1894989 RepID=UPI002FE10FB6
AYRRLSVMTKSGYLRHVRPLAEEPGVYLLTQRGIEAADLGRGRARLRLHTFRHDLLVADMAIVLGQATDGEWITERELRAGVGGIGRPGPRAHVPDGVLIHPGGARIAVEVEISSKPKARLEKLLRGYVRRPEFNQVLYICKTKRQTERIQELARKIAPGLVVVKTIEEVLKNA